MFFLSLVQHTPAWVCGPLAALVALGLWQTRPLEVSLTRVTVLPLALIVSLFLLKYGAGVSLSLAPALATDATFARLHSLAYGSFSGMLLARALSLRSLAARSVTTRAA